MSEKAAERTYTEAEVEARLKAELPKWYLENGWIRRKYKTNSWKGTLMVINTVGHLAEAAWHHPDITASYAWVEVRLMNHAARGITDKDFELAKKIEDVVQWQPGKAGGALEGTPASDQRFASSHLAAFDPGQADGDALARLRPLDIAVMHLDASHAHGSPRRLEPQLVPLADRARPERAGDDRPEPPQGKGAVHVEPCRPYRASSVDAIRDAAESAS